MIIAKLTISYDRGLSHNDVRDLRGVESSGQLFGRGDKTVDGKIIRGLGTHFKSETDRDLVTARDKEANKIRTEFRTRFLATPIDGCFVVAKSGQAKAFASSLNCRADISVRVTEFELASPNGLDGAELGEWAERIKRQLSSVSLGRSKEADADGLRALEALATCPVLKSSTGLRIKELVSQLRDAKITRVELKRNLELLDVQIEQAPLTPRRSPKIAAEVA